MFIIILIGEAIVAIVLFVVLMGAVSFLATFIPWIIFNRGKYETLLEAMDRSRLDDTDVKGFG